MEPTDPITRGFQRFGFRVIDLNPEALNQAPSARLNTKAEEFLDSHDVWFRF